MLLWKLVHNDESGSKANGETAATQVQRSVLDEGAHMHPDPLGGRQFRSGYLFLVSIAARGEQTIHVPCVGSELHPAQPTPYPLPLALPPFDTLMRENLPGEGAISGECIDDLCPEL